MHAVKRRRATGQAGVRIDGAPVRGGNESGGPGGDGSARADGTGRRASRLVLLVFLCCWFSFGRSSLVARRLSLVTRHSSLVTCHLSLVTCRLVRLPVAVFHRPIRLRTAVAAVTAARRGRRHRHCGQIRHRAGQERRVDRRAATKNRGSQAQVPRVRRRTSNARHRARGVSARRREPRARRQEPGAQRPGVGTSAAILQACRAGSVCPSTPSPESDS